MRKSLILIALAGLAACATPGKRTAIGAAVGGVAGGAVGNYLDKQAQELKEVAETTRRTKDGIMVDLKSKLLFTTDSSVLKPEAVELVAKLGDILAKYPDDRIRVAGYTDSTGSTAHNEELSLRRAKAVREVLQGRGVKPEQMLVEGMGPVRPVATNATASGRAQNRRVELHIDVPDAA